MEHTPLTFTKALSTVVIISKYELVLDSCQYLEMPKNFACGDKNRENRKLRTFTQPKSHFEDFFDAAVSRQYQLLMLTTLLKEN